jgi:hypothetical protein
MMISGEPTTKLPSMMRGYSPYILQSCLEILASVSLCVMRILRVLEHLDTLPQYTKNPFLGQVLDELTTLVQEVPSHPRRPYEKEFVWSTACDIYSLGATVAHLMSLKMPTVCQGDPEYLRSLPDQYSSALRGLVSRCCSLDVSERPASFEILDAYISRASWARTYVTPYGSLISSNFSPQIDMSWQECLKVVCPDFTSSVKESGPEKLIPRALDILALSSRAGESALPMLIAGKHWIIDVATNIDSFFS